MFNRVKRIKLIKKGEKLMELWMKSELKYRGKTQRKLAEEIGMSPVRLCNIIQMRKKANAEEIQKICENLDAKEEHLFAQWRSTR